jgi:hypothetical protein
MHSHACSKFLFFFRVLYVLVINTHSSQRHALVRIRAHASLGIRPVLVVRASDAAHTFVGHETAAASAAFRHHHTHPILLLLCRIHPQLCQWQCRIGLAILIDRVARRCAARLVLGVSGQTAAASAAALVVGEKDATAAERVALVAAIRDRGRSGEFRRAVLTAAHIRF